MKILYIDQYFSNREGISGTRAYEFARRLIAGGHQVTVLACTSRYSILGANKQDRLIRHTQIDGIEVVSIRTPYSENMGFLTRLRAFFSFMFWSTRVGLFLQRHEVIFASSTPLTVGVPALLISRLRGIPYVFEVRDLWPRAPIELGVLRQPLMIWVAQFAERLFYRFAAHVVALSPGMVEGVVAAGTPPETVSLIPNASDLDLCAGVSANNLRESLGLSNDAVVVLHAGNLGISNDGDWLLDLAAAWKKQNANHITLLLLGEGGERPRLERRREAEDLTNVVFAGPVSRQETARYLKCADFGIVSFADLPVLATNSPNKFFDYLSAGLPVLVNTHGWTAQLLAETVAGIELPRHVDEAAKRSIDLAGNVEKRRRMGLAALELAKRFDRGKLALELEAILTQATAQECNGLETILKRGTDLFFSGLAITVLSPLLIAIAIAISRETSGGVFYRQNRVGKNGNRFHLWKFRTMVANADRLGDGLNVVEEDSRITSVGRWLRDWSLDELPQLFNILSGDMSIVGPRPALAEHVAQYKVEQQKRLNAKPGLTGLAQINGRNALTWDEKLAWDVRYVNEWSWWGDWLIILKTLPVVLRREGLYETDAGKKDPFNRFDDDDRNSHAG